MPVKNFSKKLLTKLYLIQYNLTKDKDNRKGGSTHGIL